MISCTLGDKTYSVDFVTGRALREMGPAAKMYAKIAKITANENDADAPDLADAMDVLVHWFCVLFGGQFAPDLVYDHYPVDRLMHDIVLSMLAVQSQTTDILESFPTKAATGAETTIP
jgi:hypothetical protein